MCVNWDVSKSRNQTDELMRHRLNTCIKVSKQKNIAVAQHTTNVTTAMAVRLAIVDWKIKSQGPKMRVDSLVVSIVKFPEHLKTTSRFSLAVFRYDNTMWKCDCL